MTGRWEIHMPSEQELLARALEKMEKYRALLARTLEDVEYTAEADCEAEERERAAALAAEIKEVLEGS